MAFRVFVITIRDPEAGEQALNAFLRSHRVLAVKQRWVEAGENSFWTFCVDFAEKSGKSQREPTTAKVDYRKILPPEQFAQFAKLRDLRKAIAIEEGVPLYTVFTNEQLASIVQLGATSLADLQQVDGMGEVSINKYGSRLLKVLKPVQTPKTPSESEPKQDGPTSGGPV